MQKFEKPSRLLSFSSWRRVSFEPGRPPRSSAVIQPSLVLDDGPNILFFALLSIAMLRALLEIQSQGCGYSFASHSFFLGLSALFLIVFFKCDLFRKRGHRLKKAKKHWRKQGFLKSVKREGWARSISILKQNSSRGSIFYLACVHNSVFLAPP
jgi:hypothetical protein